MLPPLGRSRTRTGNCTYLRCYRQYLSSPDTGERLHTLSMLSLDLSRLGHVGTHVDWLWLARVKEGGGASTRGTWAPVGGCAVWSRGCAAGIRQDDAPMPHICAPPLWVAGGTLPTSDCLGTACEASTRGTGDGTPPAKVAHCLIMRTQDRGKGFWVSGAGFQGVEGIVLLQGTGLLLLQTMEQLTWPFSRGWDKVILAMACRWEVNHTVLDP